ncbi:MAG: hypothetical protein KAS75_08655 [Planctomycetes bacterium]|nr:hypothetical protein [Planctomycetota bacterium]
MTKISGRIVLSNQMKTMKVKFAVEIKKMAKHLKKIQKSETSVQELVVATFAEDLEQAETYQCLLKANGVSATIQKQTDDNDDGATNGQSFALMVPEDFIDEAQVVIESQNAYDDFYDFACEDEDDEDFDSDLFDDEF